VQAIVTASAREILEEQVSETKEINDSFLQRKSIDFYRRSIRNFFGELLRRAYAPVRGITRLVKSESGAAWQGIRRGAYEAIGAAVIGGATSEALGITHFTGAFVKFVSEHADALIAYASKAFNNPIVIDVINWIVWIT
jgi:hypothetical protein